MGNNTISGSSTNQQQAYDFIRDQILNLGFKPGECLTDTQIAAQLNMSRTPVREAFYRLEKEGLLINEARRGWKVYTLSLEDIHEIFDIKEAIEGMIARKASECQSEELRSDLRIALKSMDEAATSGNTEAWLQADIRLHNVLYEMADNDRAYRIITNLNDQWHRLRIGFVAMQSRTTRSVEEHNDFIDAILDGDGEKAEELMRSHLNRVREELVYLLKTVVLPFVNKGV
ncbi:MAG: GntR family transcriptional regulator [Chloroflexota bacterium]|nr:MAG: GntR family transcriptional regulator [Chloroflexota bacterium]